MTGELQGPNQVGEILAKTPTMMQGYLNKPDENKKFFCDDGFVRTGDLGYVFWPSNNYMPIFFLVKSNLVKLETSCTVILSPIVSVLCKYYLLIMLPYYNIFCYWLSRYYDDKGILYYHDRLKDLIKYNNVHIYPNAIEEVLYQHDDVAEAGTTNNNDRNHMTVDSLGRSRRWLWLSWPSCCFLGTPVDPVVDIIYKFQSRLFFQYLAISNLPNSINIWQNGLKILPDNTNPRKLPKWHKFR